jgi:hypothetical protein
MSVGSVGSQLPMMSMNGMQNRPKMDPDELKEKLTADFGADAANSVFKEDGAVDETKLQELFKSKGMRMPPGPPPGPPPGGGSAGSNQTDETSLLQKFSEDFGEDETSKITTEDGAVDYKKLWSYLSEKMQESGNTVSENSLGWPPGQLLNTRA